MMKGAHQKIMKLSSLGGILNQQSRLLELYYLTTYDRQFPSVVTHLVHSLSINNVCRIYFDSRVFLSRCGNLHIQSKPFFLTIYLQQNMERRNQ